MLFFIINKSFNTVEVDKSVWLSHIGKRSLNVLSSHAVQIDLDDIVEGNLHSFLKEGDFSINMKYIFRAC